MFRSVSLTETGVSTSNLDSESSAGGVGTPVVVSSGPTVAGVGIGCSVLAVVSVVPASVVVSTALVELSGSLVVLGDASVVTLVDSVVFGSSSVVVIAVVVTVEASVLPP